MKTLKFKEWSDSTTSNGYIETYTYRRYAINESSISNGNLYPILLAAYKDGQLDDTILGNNGLRASEWHTVYNTDDQVMYIHISDRYADRLKIRNTYVNHCNLYNDEIRAIGDIIHVVVKHYKNNCVYKQYFANAESAISENAHICTSENDNCKVTLEKISVKDFNKEYPFNQPVIYDYNGYDRYYKEFDCDNLHTWKALQHNTDKPADVYTEQPYLVLPLVKRRFPVLFNNVLDNSYINVKGLYHAANRYL